MEQHPDVHLLSDIEQDILSEPASVGARFANFIIDFIFHYAIIIGLLFVVLFTKTDEELESNLLTSESGWQVLFQYFFFYGIFIGTYTLMEGATNGKTLGKFITRTHAVRTDGAKLTWKDAFMRSLCRIVPFEAFSGFGGNPWHDRWTNTQVIKDRK